MIDLHPDLASVIQERRAISLAEMEAEASFLTRKDRKYLIPVHLLALILPQIDARANILEINGKRSFRYESHYFDTIDHQAYMSALHHRPDRFKVRVRHYCDSNLNYLEAKTRDPHGRTVKSRLEREDVARPELQTHEQNWLAMHRQIGEASVGLVHHLTTTYQRTTLVLPNSEGRITIDSHLVLSSPDGTSITTPSLAIVESKGAGKPTSADRLLWRHGIRPVSISKFGCGLSLLRPELPSNRWHRVIAQLKRAVPG